MSGMFSTWSSPNPVLYGSGSSKAVGEQLQKLGCRKVIVVFDKGVKSAGIVDRVLGYITEAGIDTVLYDGVVSDAPDYIINEAGALAVSEKADGVVGIGGGSSINTAKGVDVLLTNPPPINLYFTRPGLPPAGDLSNHKPLVVIPTTAGAGGEATPGGDCADTASNTKEYFRCPVSLGIVDPELTLGLGPEGTSISAFDALCHAVEAIVSSQPNKFSMLLGVQAITLIGQNLPAALKDGRNLKAREALHLAAATASMASLGPHGNIPHGIGAAICMMFHIPHGAAVSACLPEIFKFYAPAVPFKMKKVARALGAEAPDGSSPEEIGKIASDAVFRLMKNARLPRLADFVSSGEELLTAVPKIMETQSLRFSPRPVTAEDIADILVKSYALQLQM